MQHKQCNASLHSISNISQQSRYFAAEIPLGKSHSVLGMKHSSLFSSSWYCQIFLVDHTIHNILCSSYASQVGETTQAI